MTLTDKCRLQAPVVDFLNAAANYRFAITGISSVLRQRRDELTLFEGDNFSLIGNLAAAHVSRAFIREISEIHLPDG